MVDTNRNYITINAFAIAFYPAFNPKPKDMPIAIVNHDKGTSIQGKKMNIGDKLEDKLLDSDSKAIKWVKVDSEKDAKKAWKMKILWRCYF